MTPVPLFYLLYKLSNNILCRESDLKGRPRSSFDFGRNKTSESTNLEKHDGVCLVIDKQSEDTNQT